jgi:hypothetical protein
MAKVELSPGTGGRHREPGRPIGVENSDGERQHFCPGTRHRGKEGTMTGHKIQGMADLEAEMRAVASGKGQRPRAQRGRASNPPMPSCAY